MFARYSAAPYLIEHELGKGAIARYHLDQPAVDGALVSLRNDTDGISLSPWLMQGADTLGAADTFLNWIPAAGRLTPLMESNFLRILTKIVSLNYRWIQVAPQFYAPDPRKVGMDAFDPAWLFISWLYQTLDGLRIPFIIDAVPEFNDVYLDNPGFAQYVNAMWDNVTLTSAPGGEPCWRYSMSFIDANFDALTPAFQGNIPPVLLPHVYPSPGSASLQTTYDALAARGMGGRVWIAGEDYTLTDADSAYAQNWESFVQRTKQPVERICPWPISTAAKQGAQITVAPPVSPNVWNRSYALA